MNEDKLQWKPSKRRLYGHVCIELLYPGNKYVKEEKEYCLFGQSGGLSEYGSSRVSVIWRTPQVALKLLKSLPGRAFYALRKGEEGITVVDESDVFELINILKIPKTRPAQAREANAF